MKKCGTPPTWAEYFKREEGIFISRSAILKRLKLAEKVGENGRDRIGRILVGAFYSESDVREACADLLEDLQQVGDDGFFERDNENYGTIKSFETKLNISYSAIAHRIKKHDIQPIKGRTKTGMVCDFYPASVIREACADLLEDLQQAGDDGFFEKDDENYGTIKSFEIKLNICDSSIRSRLEENKVKPIKAKMKGGQICDFYPESDVREACADLLEDLQQAGDDGFFERDDEKYGTIGAFAENLGISSPTIKSRIEKNKVQPIVGKIKTGRIGYFYPESIVLEACADILQEIPIADKDRFIVKDRERFGTIVALAELLKISQNSIKSGIEKNNIEPIKGKIISGNICDFYSEIDVREACKDLLQELLIADEDGFFVKDSERYGTTGSLASELGISSPTIKSRIEKNNIEPIKGKTNQGVIYDFYSEIVIRKTCADLLQDISQADENGFFEEDGERYGTTYALARFFNIPLSRILNLIMKNNFEPIKGKIISGNVCDFYSEALIHEAYLYYSRQLPIADGNGVLAENCEKYRTIGGLAKKFDILRKNIEERIEKNHISCIQARMKGGQIHDFYSETAVCEVCIDLFDNLPIADDRGFFEKDDERHGTCSGLSRDMGISIPAIKFRIEKSHIQPIRGKTKGGQIHNFFSESDVRRICADLLEDLPQADEDGFFEKDGERHGTIEALAAELSVSKNAIVLRIKKNGIQPIRGKTKGGQIHNFFSESDVRRICADLLEDLPQADDNGFIEKDGERYKTALVLAKELNVSISGIKYRIEKIEIKSIKGKSKQGKICTFFSESDVRRICADLLEDLPQADDNGFIEKDGERHGTTGTLAGESGIPKLTIRSRIKRSDIQPIKGKAGGHIFNFYSESEVHEICADLLEKKRSK